MVRNNKTITTLVSHINKKYQFKDSDGSELKLYANPNLNGWEIWLYRVNGGGVTVMFTQHDQVSAKVAILILNMLLHDIFGRMIEYNYYTVTKRV